jgi:hypothetical protein
LRDFGLPDFFAAEALDTDRGVLKVDVLPQQREQFAAAQARERCR